MRKALSIVLLVLSSAVFAQDRTAVVEGMTVTLTAKECKHGRILQIVDFLAAMAPEAKGQYRAGTITDASGTAHMCFKALDKDTLFVVDELGNFGSIPAKAFGVWM